MVERHPRVGIGAPSGGQGHDPSAASRGRRIGLGDDLGAAVSAANPRRRGTILLLATSLVLTLFAGRLVELQAVRGESLAGDALDQRLRTLEIPAERGAILDDGGEPLATTMEARNVTADQTLVTDPAAVAAALGPILGAVARRAAAPADRRSTVRLPREGAHAGDLGPDRGTAAARASSASPRRVASTLLGTWPRMSWGSWVRRAPDWAASSTRTRTSSAGAPGEQTYERGPGGRVIPTGANSVTDATPGVSCGSPSTETSSTWPSRPWRSKVAEAHADSGTHGRDGSAHGTRSSRSRPHRRSTRTRQPSASDADRGNRALTNVFEPGIDQQADDARRGGQRGQGQSLLDVHGSRRAGRGGKAFHDHNAHGTLHLTLAGIMAKSSNIGTILAAERIGGKKLYKYLKKFGIGEPTGLDFPGEASGYVPPHADWSATSFPTIAFGQGLSVNAVQAASVFATIANDGVRVQPSLVAGVVHATARWSQPPAPKTTRVVSAPPPSRFGRCSRASWARAALRPWRRSPATASAARRVRRRRTTRAAAATAA